MSNSNIMNVSVGSLWSLALPMMLSALTGNLMQFADRAILASYSLNAFNAASIATITVAVPQYCLVGVANIAEVFVGQHHGARCYQLLAQPVWQMIWLSVALLFVFLPIALLTSHLFIPHEYAKQGIPFFHWIMASAPLSGVIAALSAFYIGRGKPRLILISTLIANIVNIGLDFILIFGIHNYIPSMGAQGAAIATASSLTLQAVILFVGFLRKQHRQQYATHHCQLHWHVLREELRIGLPNAIGHMIEIGAWATQMRMMATLGPLYITVLTVGQTLFLLLAFVTDGLAKGVIAIASNLIGNQQIEKTRNLIGSGIRLHMIILTILAIPMLVTPQPLLALFTEQATQVFNSEELFYHLRITLFFVWLYFGFDGMVWVVAGILTSFKDTVFIMLANATAAWVFAILPTYFLIVQMHLPANMCWAIISVYGVINFLFFY